MNRVYKFARNKKSKIGLLIALVFAGIKMLDINLPYESADEIGIIFGVSILLYGLIDKAERYFKWSRVDKK